MLDAKRKQAEAKASERHALIGWLIAALVFFYFSVDAGMRDYKRFNKATGVAQGKVVELRGEDDDRGDAITIADYKFKVNGTDYDGSTEDESLSKGSPVEVYYNPANPDLNHAKGDGPKNGFFNQWTVFGIICLIATFGTIREKRKQSRVASV